MKEKIGRATRVIGASRKLRKIIARELLYPQNPNRL